MASSTATNMYRVGDYVYFEINSSSPYQIRRIEELNKTQAGNVEAKVMCFYRRRDIAPALLKIIDERPAPTVTSSNTTLTHPTPHAPTVEAETTEPKQTVDVKTEEPTTDEVKMETTSKPSSPAPLTASDEKPAESAEAMDTKESKESIVEPIATAAEKTTTTTSTGPKTAVRMPGEENLSESEKHRLLHRELFLSRQIETLPATHIRGKCSVTLLNEIETPDSYIERDDMFFYSLVYDPTQKTLIADKGEIRIGDKYQAQITDLLPEEEKEGDRNDAALLETLIYKPYHQLTDRQIDQFIIVAKSVGTFARALDMSSSAKQPNLHLTAAAASRDVTPFQALALLHQGDYDLAKTMSFLVPPAHKQWYPIDADKATALHTSTLGGPLMCRDQLEEWSAAEANLFDEALEKYGKDFNDIRQDFLPWKALRDIVEYYYMWKTTDRYVQQKRVKANEAESRLKQVYIPAYSKPNPNVLTATNPFTPQSNKCCEGCSVDSCDQWYAWGPPGAFLRLCKDCWSYWKKFGGLKREHTYESFDKISYQHSDQVTTSVPRPSDRLEAYDANVRRCLVSGCNRQFANSQLLSQHVRRDHYMQGEDGDSSSPTLIGRSGGGETAGLIGRNVHMGPQAIRAGAPRTRASFYIRTTPITKVSRRVAPKSLLNVKRLARNPFDVINMAAIKQNCQTQPAHIIRSVLKMLYKNVPIPTVTSTTLATAKQPSSAATSVIKSGNRGSVQMGTTFPQKRAHTGTSSWDAVVEPSAKRFKGQNELFLKWIRTVDDCYFHATKQTKNLRRVLNNGQFRRAGRRPYRTQEYVSKLLKGH